MNSATRTTSQRNDPNRSQQVTQQYFAQFREPRVNLNLAEAGTLTVRIGDSISKKLKQNAFDVSGEQISLKSCELTDIRGPIRI